MIETEVAPIDTCAIAQLFTDARTHNGWLAKPVPGETLKRLYEMVRMGPTSMNCQPMRLVFVVSAEGKEHLRPALNPTNVDKTMQAPVTVIVAYDTRFYDLMPTIWHRPAARDTFAENETLARSTAIRNGSMQGGYLILAARALGLDCGPMSGFNIAKVDAEFFPDGRWTANFLCNLGYGDAGKLHDRQRRLDFDEACRVL
ncbi:MAG: malonic semialdehyde reductase [Burkholderiaceae bacterium]